MKKRISLMPCICILLSSSFLAFGMYNIHSPASISEGGILGLVLLLQNWFHFSPAVSSFVLNGFCYLLGWRTFGKSFLFYSILATIGYSVCYGICEQFDPLFPEIASMPLAASLIGSLFVGIGCGVCVRIGGAPTGDDAFAMSIFSLTGISIQWIYLVSDLTVLLLSLSYIPLQRIGYSLLTVFLSGQIIGILQKKSS